LDRTSIWIALQFGMTTQTPILNVPVVGVDL